MRNTSLDKPQRALVSGIEYSWTWESRNELLLALPHGAICSKYINWESIHTFKFYGSSDSFKYAGETTQLVLHHWSKFGRVLQIIILHAPWVPSNQDRIRVGKRARASLRTIIIHRIITSRLSYHLFQTRNKMKGEVDWFNIQSWGIGTKPSKTQVSSSSVEWWELMVVKHRRRA